MRWTSAWEWGSRHSGLRSGDISDNLAWFHHTSSVESFQFQELIYEYDDLKHSLAGSTACSALAVADMSINFFVMLVSGWWGQCLCHGFSPNL
jgi:hypothetical protein